MASCNKKTCFTLFSPEPLRVSHTSKLQQASCRVLKCTLHFWIYLSLSISYIAHFFWGEAWWGKTPSNRSAERPISHSTICPSNDYLAALWCDTVGWRASIANILSLSLYISTQYSTTDGTWSALCLFNAYKYSYKNICIDLFQDSYNSVQ